MKRRVVITGYGLVTPLGMETESVWRRLCLGESGIRSLPADGPLSVFRSKIAGSCDDFTVDGVLEVKEARRLDRFTQFAMVAADRAVKESGLDFSTENPFRCASIIGSGVGGLGEIEHQQDRIRALGPSKVSPFTIPKIIINSAAGNIAIRYGIHGPTRGISTACASANDAMAEAFRSILLDETDVVITGGTESALTGLGIAGFSAMKALSERNDDPAGASRPFDLNRDGFVLSEGAGILLFEELEHAKKRNAPILGEFLGSGLSTDACHVTQPDREGVYAAAAMEAALHVAALTPDKVDYINLHGTGTKLGDVAETAAIHRAMGESARKVAMSSTKSQIGHLLGGSGGVELIFSLLAIRDGLIPPTINLTESDPECDLDFTPLVARERPVRVILSNSFGFGGHNACVAAGRFDG